METIMENNTKISSSIASLSDKPISGQNVSGLMLGELFDTNITNNTIGAVSENVTDILSRTGKTTNYRYLYYVIYAAIMIPTVFGNTLILASIAKYRNLRKSMHILIGNLAFADLLVGVAVIPFDIIGDSFPDIKKHKYVCLIEYSMAGFTLFYSCVCLLLITADRFLAVTFPFEHRRFNGQNLYIVMFSGFLFTFVVSSLPLVWNNYVGSQTLPCYTEVVWPEAYRRTIQFMWLIMILASLVLYCVVFRVALKRVKKLKQINEANSQRKRLITKTLSDQSREDIRDNTEHKRLEKINPEMENTGSTHTTDLNATKCKNQDSVVETKEQDYKPSLLNNDDAGHCEQKVSFHAPAKSVSAKSSADIRRTIMMFVVLIVFAVCWSPYLIVNVILTFFKSPLLQFIQKWLLGLGVLNSGMNWIIYSLTSKEFKRAFSSILKLKCS